MVEVFAAASHRRRSLEGELWSELLRYDHFVEDDGHWTQWVGSDLKPEIESAVGHDESLKARR